ncbi:MAG: signal peptidase II [Phycisphaerae bacterium]|jgi:signal peptidase II
MREENNISPDSNQASLNNRLPMPDLPAQLIFWSIVVLGISLDIWSKKAVFDWLENRGIVQIIPGALQLVRALNNGAAFGIFAGHSFGLIAISLIALLVIFAVFLFGGVKQRLVQVSLGLFAAGVCGNLYDRIFNDGHVRDFIDVYYRQHHWPAFNVADSMLCIAVGLGIISCLWPQKQSSQLKETI